MEEDLGASSVPGWAVGLIVAALLLVLGLGAFYFVLAHRQAEAEKAWARLGPELTRFQKAYPKTAANASALSLDDNAARLGIDASSEKGEGPPGPERARFEAVAKPLADFVLTEASRAEEGIGEPPEGVRSYLEANREGLRGLRNDLLAYESPRWNQDVSLGPRAPVPDVAGLQRVQRLLVAQVLVEARSGRPQEAERFLEASYRLNGSLIGRPELLSVLAAVSAARLQAGALRQLPAASQVWRDRLAKPDLAEAFFSALGNEGLFVAVAQKDPSLRGGHALFAGAMAAAVAQLRRESPCRFTRPKAQAIWEKALAGAVGPVALPNLSDAVHRLFRALLERELTRKVLEARASRFDMTSEVCPQAKWAYRFGAGTGTIAFEGTFEDWAESGAPRPPLAFTFRQP